MSGTPKVQNWMWTFRRRLRRARSTFCIAGWRGVRVTRARRVLVAALPRRFVDWIWGTTAVAGNRVAFMNWPCVASRAQPKSRQAGCECERHHVAQQVVASNPVRLTPRHATRPSLISQNCVAHVSFPAKSLAGAFPYECERCHRSHATYRAVGEPAQFPAWFDAALIRAS